MEIVMHVSKVEQDFQEVMVSQFNNGQNRIRHSEYVYKTVLTPGHRFGTPEIYATGTFELLLAEPLMVGQEFVVSITPRDITVAG